MRKSQRMACQNNQKEEVDVETVRSYTRILGTSGGSRSVMKNCDTNGSNWTSILSRPAMESIWPINIPHGRLCRQHITETEGS